MGHTHFDVDQSIGLDKRFLRKKNVFTLPLISMLNFRRSEHSSVEELHTCRDWRNCIAQYYRPLTGINKNGWKCFSISAKGIRGRGAYDGEYEWERVIKMATAPETVILTPLNCKLQRVDERVLQNIALFKQHIPKEYHKWWDDLQAISNSIQAENTVDVTSSESDQLLEQNAASIVTHDDEEVEQVTIVGTASGTEGNGMNDHGVSEDDHDGEENMTSASETSVLLNDGKRKSSRRRVPNSLLRGFVC